MTDFLKTFAAHMEAVEAGKVEPETCGRIDERNCFRDATDAERAAHLAMKIELAAVAERHIAAAVAAGGFVAEAHSTVGEAMRTMSLLLTKAAAMCVGGELQRDVWQDFCGETFDDVAEAEDEDAEAGVDAFFAELRAALEKGSG